MPSPSQSFLCEQKKKVDFLSRAKRFLIKYVRSTSGNEKPCTKQAISFPRFNVTHFNRKGCAILPPLPFSNPRFKFILSLPHGFPPTVARTHMSQCNSTSARIGAFADLVLSAPGPSIKANRGKIRFSKRAREKSEEISTCAPERREIGQPRQRLIKIPARACCRILLRGCFGHDLWSNIIFSPRFYIVKFLYNFKMK